MREITSGNPNSTIIIQDGPGEGGASHHYCILPSKTPDHTSGPSEVYAEVFFQKGPIRENGVNGCHQEDLLEIVIDRLRSFQDGPFACRENALALTRCQEAMHWLNHRTIQRTKRGVEGINVK